MKPAIPHKQLTRLPRAKPISVDFHATPLRSVHTFRDLSSVRSNRKRSMSPDGSPQLEETVHKLKDVEMRWKAMKTEISENWTGSQSANVSLNDSTSPSAAKLQSLKLIQVLKAGSSPEPTLPISPKEGTSPRSLLFKKKSASPHPALHREMEKKLISKAYQFATKVASHREPESHNTPKPALSANMHFMPTSGTPRRDGSAKPLSSHKPRLISVDMS